MSKQKQKPRRHSYDHPKMSSSQKIRNHFGSLKAIKQSYQTDGSPKNLLHFPRDKLISKLSSPLMRKLIIDNEASKALQQNDDKKLKRLQRIQAQIQMINIQNAVKIKFLTQMEKTFVKKIQRELQKDQQIEAKLLQEYTKLQKEEEQIHFNKNVKKIMQNKDWIEIQKQQRKLELLTRSFQKMQNAIGRDKYAVLQQKQKKGPQEKRKRYQSDKSPKRERKKLNVEQMKEMGRQFLEHAKKIRDEKQKQKYRVLDIHKKSIDYLPQLVTLVKNNAEDLSVPLASFHPKKKTSKRSSLIKIEK